MHLRRLRARCQKQHNLARQEGHLFCPSFFVPKIVKKMNRLGKIIFYHEGSHMNLTSNELLEMEQTLRNAWMNVSADIGTEEEVAYHKALHHVRRLRLYIQDTLTSDRKL